MKKLAVALVAALLASAAHAQEARRPFGIGIAINPAQAPSPTVEIYVPLSLGPTLRLEPSVGLSSIDRPTGQTDSRDFTLGAGLFYVQRVAAPLDLYMGGRVKLNFASSTSPTGAGGTNTTSGTDVLIAGALGAEDYLTPHFSIGAEANLGFASNSEASGDASAFFTTGLAFLRFYF